MQTFEYMVVPAPKAGHNRGQGSEEQLARTLQDEMNRLGAEGWEYQRTDSLPFEEQFGPGGRRTGFHSVLVFRRRREAAAPAAVLPFAAPVAQAPLHMAAPDGYPQESWPRRDEGERPAQIAAVADEPAGLASGSDLLDVAVRLRADQGEPGHARTRGDKEPPARGAIPQDGHGRATLPPLVLGREDAITDESGRGALSPTLEERAAALARKMAAE